MIKEYFKTEWKGMLTALAVSLVLALICGAYIYFIGMPITEARNKFNEGVKAMDIGDNKTAKSLFEESNKLWWTAETQQYLDKTK